MTADEAQRDEIQAQPELRLRRREALAGAALTAALAALPGDAQAHGRSPQPASASPSLTSARRTGPRADVVIVGAGLAGLTAARRLIAAGRSVIVLEARDRVGGRTLNHQLGDGKVIEVGGQWVSPDHHRVLALARQLGIGTFPTYNTGSNVYYTGSGKPVPYNTGGPLGPIPPDPSGVADLERFILQINQMAAQVPVEKPWTASHAVDWDGQTLETFKQSVAVTPNGKALIDLCVGSLASAQCGELSLLWMAAVTAAATNGTAAPDFTKLISVRGGTEQARFIGGSQLICIRMAKQLGKRLLLHEPVRIIAQSTSNVTVTTDHLTVSAKHVIVTAPPALTALIRYEPGLPWMRAQLTQRYPQGSVIKCEVIYDTPFWRDRGLTGQATSLTGAIKFTFDNSPPDGKPGVLVGFLEGSAARQAMALSPAARRTLVLEDFATYFGQAAARPTQYVEMNWSTEPWTRGGYDGFLPPGVLVNYGPAIRAPVGRIHWAGGEGSIRWANFMEGAVQSGDSAAAEVLSVM